MSDWFLHGTRVDTVAIDDRAVQYGDGLFETIAVRDGQPRFWELHMRRLGDGCERLGLSLPAESLLMRDFERALSQARVNTSYCVAKLIITAGAGARGYRRAEPAAPTTLIGVFDDAPLEQALYANGVVAQLCTTQLSVQPKLAGLKTLNRLDQVLAAAELRGAEVFEGLMCDDAGHVVCGTRSNLFVTIDDHIATPSLTRAGVAGIMRHHIVHRLRDNGIDCAERDFSLDEIRSADELFLCNSQFGVLPVRRFDDQEYAVGEATRSVMTMLSWRKVPECRP